MVGGDQSTVINNPGERCLPKRLNSIRRRFLDRREYSEQTATGSTRGHLGPGPDIHWLCDCCSAFSVSPSLPRASLWSRPDPPDLCHFGKVAPFSWVSTSVKYPNFFIVSRIEILWFLSLFVDYSLLSIIYIIIILKWKELICHEQTADVYVFIRNLIL